MTTRATGRAVVLGASMAGLLAARVLAERYGRVTVVDRDDLAREGGQRRGVPQGRHLHALMPRGQEVLEELFPGLTRDLVARRASTLDVQNDVRWFLNGHRLRQAESGLVVLGASRPCLEAGVRARVRAIPGVEFVQRDVAGLAVTADGRRVVGARVSRAAAGGAVERIAADVVVDATGRGSRTPVWLEELGYPRPAEEQVRIGLVYTSRHYRLRPGALGDDLAILHGLHPGHPRGGGVALLEDGRHLVTLAGILGDHAPGDPDGYLAFARSLEHPDLYEAIRDGEPLDDAVTFRFPASVRRRYERLEQFPDGLLPMGDAVCSFNPVYAQGMSVAALEASALREHLRGGREPEPLAFLRDIARVVDVPWSMAVGGDLAFAEVAGRRTAKVRLGNAYTPLLHAAGAEDAGLAGAFLRVAGLVDPPATLTRPGVLGRVLRHSLRHAWIRSPGRARPRPPIPARVEPEPARSDRDSDPAAAPACGHPAAATA